MCSLDIARKQLALKGNEMLEETLRLARWARAEINSIDGLYAFGRELAGSPGCFDFDETKLGIHVRRLGYTGYEMEAILRKNYNIQIEMSDLYNILAVVSLGDSKKNLQCFIDALKDIARKSDSKRTGTGTIIPIIPEIAATPRTAYFSEKKVVALDNALGEVAGEIIMAYPPGIPVVGIGERITQDIIDYIKVLKREKCQLQSSTDPKIDYIKVLAY